MATKELAKMLVRTGSVFPVSGDFLYETSVLACSTETGGDGLCASLFFSLQDVSQHVEHPVAALYEQDAEKKKGKKMSSPKRECGEIVRAGNCRGHLLV